MNRIIIFFLAIIFSQSNTLYAKHEKELLACARQKNLYKLKQLIKDGGNIYAKDWRRNLLHIAAGNGDVEMMKFLINKGIDVNSRGTHGFIPLYFAIYNKQFKAVKFLVNQGADINDNKNESEYSMLYYAESSHKLNIIEILLDHGVNDNILNENIVNINLILSARNNNVKMVKRYLKKGANINTKGYLTNKNTPLHHAVLNNNYLLVKYLISKGAKINLKNKDENTPLDVAAMNNYLDIKLLLQQKHNDKGN